MDSDSADTSVIGEREARQGQPRHWQIWLHVGLAMLQLACLVSNPMLTRVLTAARLACLGESLQGAAGHRQKHLVLGLGEQWWEGQRQLGRWQVWLHAGLASNMLQLDAYSHHQQ